MLNKFSGQMIGYVNKSVDGVVNYLFNALCHACGIALSNIAIVFGFLEAEWEAVRNVVGLFIRLNRQNETPRNMRYGSCKGLSSLDIAKNRYRVNSSMLYNRIQKVIFVGIIIYDKFFFLLLLCS